MCDEQHNILKIFKSATTTVQQQQYHFEVMMYK